LRGIAAGVVSVGAAVSVASAAGFGFGLWRRGFDELVFAGAIVVDELEFCAETMSPVLINAPKTAIITAITKE